MEKYILYKNAKLVIDDFIEALDNKDPNKLARYRDLFYYRFYSNQELREEIVDIIPNENVECVSYTLDIVRTCNSGFLGETFRGYRGSIDKKNAIENLKYLSNLLNQEITNYDESIKTLNLNYFIDDMLTICRIIQANHLYKNADENNRNDYVRDMLEFKGYVTKDQTRHGVSMTGKNSGEVDILICKNKIQKESVVEGLNLSYCDKNKIFNHYSKIFKYDTTGNDYNVMLSYVNVDDFFHFVLEYKKCIENVKEPFGCNSIETIRIDDCSTISLLKSTHTRNEKITYIYHFIVLFQNV